MISPARKARTGRIGLRPTGDGFGTPAFEDGSRLVVRGDRLEWQPGESTRLTTIRAAAGFVGVELSPDPGVGHDLPPYEPDAELAVDADASLALGAWYGFGQEALDGVGAAPAVAGVSEAQLWPEHFDLAVIVDLTSGERVNVGFSPGDTFCPDPYLYVGPHDPAGLSGPYWNAPFGAYLDHSRLAGSADPPAAAASFIADGLQRLSTGRSGGAGR